VDLFKHLTLLIKVPILHDRDLQEEARSQSYFFFVGDLDFGLFSGWEEGEGG
jgi:hypothetical protein